MNAFKPIDHPSEVPDKGIRFLNGRKAFEEV